MSDTTTAVIIALLLINLVGLMVVGAYVSSQAKDNRRQDQSLTDLDARVKNMPTHRDLIELRSDISKVVETVALISGQTQSMTQMLRTIQEHLLENDR